MERTILVTGFKAIGDHTVSPIQKFLEHYCVPGNCTMRSLLFPPYNFHMGAENFGKQIVERAKELEAAAIISLGVSPEVKGLRIEARALNWAESRSDLRPDGDRKLEDKYPAGYPRKVQTQHWDFNSMFEKFNFLSIEFEEKISVFPGYYCGNALMYRTLEALELYSCNIPYLFIHFPYKSMVGTEHLIPTLDTLRKTIAVVSESYKGEPKALHCPAGSDAR